MFRPQGRKASCGIGADHSSPFFCLRIASTTRTKDATVLVMQPSSFASSAGGSLSGISPLSTGGALAMAALATALPNRTKEDENKTFVQLFIYAGLAIVILIVLCSTIYVPLANLLHG